MRLATVDGVLTEVVTYLMAAAVVFVVVVRMRTKWVDRRRDRDDRPA